MPALAQQAPARGRPVIGLVLGGGGARGGAHLGVLEVLEDLRIPIDCIAGTSMGALVGGAYASGISPKEMREKIGKTDWDAMFDDSASRDLQNLRRRALDDRFFSSLEFGVTDDGLKYREGAIAGEKIKLFFSELVRADLGEKNIEQLSMPLTLIASDIVTGERVAMRSGSLTSAMRASMSVPGAIAPVNRDGHKLVDGGLVDNVPIQEVRDRCKADVVIAINVGSPMLKGDQVAGAVSVVAQMVNLLTEQNVSKSLSLLTPRDVYMRPELGAITAMDFARQLEAANIGRQAALAQADKLRAYSLPPEQYAAWRAALQKTLPATNPVIAEIVVADTRFVNRDELRANVSQKTGEPLDTRKLADELVLIYSRGDLASLDYTVLTEREKTILKLVPVEKPWGPDYLRFGFNAATDFRIDTAFNLRALYRKTWLNAFGGEWVATGQLGTTQGIATEFYQPMDYRQVSFVRPYAAASSRIANLYFDGERLAEYRVPEYKAGLDVGVNLGIYGQAKVGWMEKKSSAHLETGSPVLPDIESRVGGITSTLAIDQYNFAFFPTKGYKIDVDYFDAQRVGSGPAYSRVEGTAAAAIPITERISFLPTLAGGTKLKGDLPPDALFSLGGLGRLSAFAPGQILAEEYAFASARLEYRLLRPVPVLGLSVLAGVGYERAHVKNPITEPNLRGRIDSYGAYIGATTPLGPVYVGWAGTQDRRGRVYFFLGTP
jgi:NTE family protein